MADVEADIAYGNAGDVELRLDIFRPAGESRRTAILFFHGGGWRRGSKNAMHPYAEALAESGFVGIPVQYRLLDQAPWPAQLHDVKAAIRWTRANARKLDIDPERVVLCGASAGAHLSLMAAGTPDNSNFEDSAADTDTSCAAAAVIAFFPPTGFYHGEPDERYLASGAMLLGEGYGAEAAHDASPISHVGPDFPPTFLVHGTRDGVVHHAHSVAMLNALRKVRVPADLHLFHGHTHEFVAIPSVRKLVMAEIAYFLERSVIEPEKYQAEAEEFSMFARRAAEQRGKKQNAGGN